MMKNDHIGRQRIFKLLRYIKFLRKTRIGIDDNVEVLNVDGKHIVLPENQVIHFQQLKNLWK